MKKEVNVDKRYSGDEMLKMESISERTVKDIQDELKGLLRHEPIVRSGEIRRKG